MPNPAVAQSSRSEPSSDGHVRALTEGESRRVFSSALSIRGGLAMTGRWRVDPGYLDPPSHSPERAWLRDVAQSFRVRDEPTTNFLRLLATGSTVTTAMRDCGLVASEESQFPDLLQRLAGAGVLLRAAPDSGRNRSDP
jgi:hypothetical protein